MARIAEISRQTKETDIFIRLNLDGSGEAKIDYPIGFMVHMLNTFARHSLFDIEIEAAGDLQTDQHHLIEDTGLVLGQCFSKALGERKGIRRVGSCLFPMDETLARSAVDLSGRPYLVFEAGLSGIPLISAGNANPKGSTAERSSADRRSAISAPADDSNVSGDFQTDTVEDFWQAFVSAAALTLHLDILRGRSDHHKIEALFKAAARSLREASEIDMRSAEIIPSTKGTLLA